MNEKYKQVIDECLVSLCKMRNDMDKIKVQHRLSEFKMLIRMADKAIEAGMKDLADECYILIHEIYEELEPVKELVYEVDPEYKDRFNEFVEANKKADQHE